MATTARVFNKTEKIINIQNDDERCFGCALLYFLERANLLKMHCFRATRQRKNVPATPSRHFPICNLTKKCLSTSKRESPTDEHQCILLL